MVLSGMRLPASWQEAQAEDWDVELRLGPFFATVDQKGLKRHLKVGEVKKKKKKRKKPAEGMADS